MPLEGRIDSKPDGSIAASLNDANRPVAVHDFDSITEAAAWLAGSLGWGYTLSWNHASKCATVEMAATMTQRYSFADVKASVESTVIEANGGIDHETAKVAFDPVFGTERKRVYIGPFGSEGYEAMVGEQVLGNYTTIYHRLAPNARAALERIAYAAGWQAATFDELSPGQARTEIWK